MDGSTETNIAKENFTGTFFLGSLSQIHAIQLFFRVVSPHGNVDSDEYKLLQI